VPPLRRLLVPPAQLATAADSRVALTPEQSRYLVSVLRLSPGDPLELFDGQGARRPARLGLGGSGAPVLELLEPIAPVAGDPAGRGSALDEGLDIALARGLDIALAQALVKADKLELVIQKATELGARRVAPFAAERSVVKLDKLDDDRGSAKVSRWRKIAEEASRQCGRADVPQIDPPMRWDDLFAWLAAEPDRRGIALDPLATMRLGEAARGAEQLLLAVGPEGGFSDTELARAEQQGFLRASLGPLVLRTETAGLAALAVVQHLAGQLG